MVLRLKVRVSNVLTRIAVKKQTLCVSRGQKGGSRSQNKIISLKLVTLTWTQTDKQTDRRYKDRLGPRVHVRGQRASTLYIKTFLHGQEDTTHHMEKR